MSRIPATEEMRLPTSTLPLFSFVTGSCVLQQLPVLPGPVFLGLVLLTGVLLAGLQIYTVGLCLLGFVWAAFIASLTLSESFPNEWNGQDILVTGTVASIPQKSDRAVRFEFKIKTVNTPAGPVIPSLVRLTWYDGTAASSLKAGQAWTLTIRLKQPRGSLNPGGFDYEKWLFAQGIRATGYVRNTTENQLMAESRWSLDAFRQRLNDRLNIALASSPLSGIVSALTIGNRGNISAKQWDVFRRTSTSHLVAISGLHIGLIAGLVYFLTQWFWAFTGWLRWSPPRVAATLSLLAALVYAGLAGFSIPTQRALIMVAVTMGGVILQRRIDPWRLLAIAMFLVVVIDPIAVVQSGFWLSFGAVALIVFSLAGRIGRPGYWIGSVKVQIILSLGMAPILAYYIQQISLVAPLANLVAVPIFSFLIVPLCLLGVLLLDPIPTIANGILHIADIALQGIWIFLGWLSTVSFSQWDFTQPSLPALSLAMAGVLLLCAPRGIPARWAGLVLLIPLIIPKQDHLGEREILLTLLDVGQGLAVVVTTRRHTLVFDTGAKFSDKFDMGSAVVLPFLKSRGIKKIDILVISHGDNDHIGGANSLRQYFSVDSVLTSAPEQLPWDNVTRCDANQNWQWDGVEFSIISPSHPGYSGENDNSCVLKITAGENAILLTGDIEKPAENDLVKKYGKTLKSDILVVPHHGSATSSTESLLESVQPRFALFPTGFYNRFGFPNEAVVERYRQIGATVLQTGKMGAIQFKIGVDGIVGFDLYRLSHRRYWHAGNDD
ncbi:MAG: DNA internalization-related competence protein ComEC/Rec2 [Methylococcales bacterium]